MFLGCFVGSCLAALMVTGGTNGPVTLHGKQIGLYVDNETPDPCTYTEQDQGLVLLGVYGPQLPAGQCPGAVSAIEWYPFGFYHFKIGPPPCGYQAYIIQWRFAWPRHRPPTVKQRRLLLRQTERCHPAFVIRY